MAILTDRNRARNEAFENFCKFLLGVGLGDNGVRPAQPCAKLIDRRLRRRQDGDRESIPSTTGEIDQQPHPALARHVEVDDSKIWPQPAAPHECESFLAIARNGYASNHRACLESLADQIGVRFIIFCDENLKRAALEIAGD